MSKGKQEQAYIDALKKFREKVESDLPTNEPILTRGGRRNRYKNSVLYEI